ncbi:MAG: uracil-DNA glycosylase [Caldimicrobium sp.]
MTKIKANLLEALKSNFRYLEELGFNYFPYFKEFEFFIKKKPLLTHEDISSLFEKIKQCQDCSLYRIRKQPVLDENFADKKLMLIGDYPDKDDNYFGKPFSGSIGEILQKMLLSIGLRKEDFYITLTVKCKPTAGKIPEEEEIQACKKYLLKEIKLLKPKLILALGFLPPKVILEVPTTFSNLRGKPFPFRESMIIFTYHPSYMLKNPTVKRLIWEDLKAFRALYEKVF